MKMKIIISFILLIIFANANCFLLKTTTNTTTTPIVAAASEMEAESADVELNTRIIGGTATSIKNFPYQVSVQHKNQHICGGAIIKRNLVISAAHCFYFVDKPQEFKVRAGSSLHKANGQLMNVGRIIKHDNYTFASKDNDIAIIVLTKFLYYNDKVGPVLLPNNKQYKLPIAAKFFVSGWGLTNPTGNLSHVLQNVEVALIAQSICIENYTYIAEVTDNMFCAGYIKGGRDSCQGDSGGPLVRYVNKQPILYGLVSFGLGCGDEGFPGVYTNITAMLPWINKIANQIKSI